MVRCIKGVHVPFTFDQFGFRASRRDDKWVVGSKKVGWQSATGRWLDGSTIALGSTTNALHDWNHGLLAPAALDRSTATATMTVQVIVWNSAEQATQALFALGRDA
jgi:hypothetical protein